MLSLFLERMCGIGRWHNYDFNDFFLNYNPLTENDANKIHLKHNYY